MGNSSTRSSSIPQSSEQINNNILKEMYNQSAGPGTGLGAILDVLPGDEAATSRRLAGQVNFGKNIGNILPKSYQQQNK